MRFVLGKEKCYGCSTIRSYPCRILFIPRALQLPSSLSNAETFHAQFITCPTNKLPEANLICDRCTNMKYFAQSMQACFLSVQNETSLLVLDQQCKARPFSLHTAQLII